MNKKKLLIILLALAALILFIVIMAATLRSGSVFTAASYENSITLEAMNAQDGAVTTGTLTLGENEQIEVQADLREGEAVTVEMFPADHRAGAEPLFRAYMTGQDGSTYTYEAGDYDFVFTAGKDAAGSITVKTAPAQ